MRTCEVETVYFDIPKLSSEPALSKFELAQQWRNLYQCKFDIWWTVRGYLETTGLLSL